MMNTPKKHIISHFTEDDTDPIVDMGIGGYSFETLSPGAILAVNPEFRSFIALTHNQSGQFTSWHSGFKIAKDHHLVVNFIREDRLTKYKHIQFKRFYTKADAIEYRNEWLKLKQAGLSRTPWGGSTNTMIVSKLQFERRFIIIERGFNFVRESLEY